MSDAAERAGIPERQDVIDAAYLAQHEQQLAEQRLAAIEAGRRKGGVAGAALAGAMSIVSEILERPKRDDAPVVVEANSDPLDVDRDGVNVELGDVAVETPALERLAPVTPPGKGLRKPPVV